MHRPTGRGSSGEETVAKILSSQRHCQDKGGRNQNLSGRDKIVNLCPLYLFDYDTSVISSIRTTEHGPVIDRRNWLCQS